MHDSIRKIVENRLVSIGGDSYITEAGDTISDIVNKNPKARDVANLKLLNPTYTTFENDLIITFITNNLSPNSGINISGFTGGFLRPSETVLTSLAFHNTRTDGIAGFDTFNEFLAVRNSSPTANIGDKVDSWVSEINKENNDSGAPELGFTAEKFGTNSIRIIPKDRINNAFEVDTLSLTRNDFVDASIDHVYLPPQEWIIVDRKFPLFLEGRQFTPPTNESFAILMIQDAATVGREFGTLLNTRLRTGTVRLKLYAPFGTGTKIVRDMADQFDSVLSYTAGDSMTGVGGTLFMKAGSLSQVAENSNGFLEYNLDYIYDYYTSA